MKKLYSVGIKLALVVAASAAGGQSIFYNSSKALRTRASENESAGLAPRNMIRVPLTRQGLSYTCGPAALSSILYYYDKSKDFFEDELAKELKSNEEDGTLIKEMVRVAEAEGFTATTFYNWNLGSLKASIDRGVPVIVLLQAWAATDQTSHDYGSDWVDGHFAIVIGYDKANLYFMDPSTFGNYTFVPINEFLERWHDFDGADKVFNFGMTIVKDTPWYNRDKIFKME